MEELFENQTAQQVRFVEWNKELFEKYYKDFEITIYNRIEGHRVYEISRSLGIEEFSYDFDPEGCKYLGICNEIGVTHIYPTKDIILKIPRALFEIFDDLEPTKDLYIEIVPQPR